MCVNQCYLVFTGPNSYKLSLVSDDITLRYPFFFRPMFDVIENGWQAYSAETEFNRFKGCQEDWRISYVNKDYKV